MQAHFKHETKQETKLVGNEFEVITKKTAKFFPKGASSYDGTHIYLINDRKESLEKYDPETRKCVSTEEFIWQDNAGFKAMPRSIFAMKDKGIILFGPGFDVTLMNLEMKTSDKVEGLRIQGPVTKYSETQFVCCAQDNVANQFGVFLFDIAGERLNRKLIAKDQFSARKKPVNCNRYIRAVSLDNGNLVLASILVNYKLPCGRIINSEFVTKDNGFGISIENDKKEEEHHPTTFSYCYRFQLERYTQDMLGKWKSSKIIFQSSYESIPDIHIYPMSDNRVGLVFPKSSLTYQPNFQIWDFNGSATRLTNTSVQDFAGDWVYSGDMVIYKQVRDKTLFFLDIITNKIREFSLKELDGINDLKGKLSVSLSYDNDVYVMGSGEGGIKVRIVPEENQLGQCIQEGMPFNYPGVARRLIADYVGFFSEKKEGSQQVRNAENNVYDDKTVVLQSSPGYG